MRRWRASFPLWRVPQWSTQPGPQCGGRELPGLDGLPAGAAFAAFALGFLGGSEQKVFRNGRWFRLSGLRGHVLVRTGAGLGLGF